MGVLGWGRTCAEQLRLHVNRPAVNEQSLPLLAQDGDQLVHDAAGHAGMGVLCLLTG